jgi:CheY-like chemotaxis protein/two-component sensor histidine kinase
VTGIFVVGVDVSDRHIAEQTLRDAERRKDEFLATLAHELRNPLAPIRNAASLLLSKGLPADRVAWCGAVIQRQVGMMAALLDDLLEVSRITSGKLALRMSSFEIASVVETAVETARTVIDSRGHVLEVKLPAASARLVADPLRLVQVLTNLLTNAAKYTEPGGHILLEVRELPGEVVFNVTDNGVGIAAEQMPTLFRLFEQGQSTLDRSQGGLGIGLAFSKGLVQLHGGRIEAISAGPGRGSTFRVSLPAEGDAVPVEPPASIDGSAPAIGAGIAVAAKPAAVRVLIADDNVDAATALAMVLEMEGYEVRVAHDGLQALASAELHRPRVALLDIGMPGLNGYQLARELRAREWGPSMLLVAMTGWGMGGDRQRAFDAGYDVHLTKPVPPDTLIALLKDRLAAPP